MTSDADLATAGLVAGDLPTAVLVAGDLPAGTIVAVPRSDVMHAVTEYGTVRLKGKSVAGRARAMISTAHCDFRADLERDACDKGLVARAFRS